MTKPKPKGQKQKAGRKSTFSNRKEAVLVHFTDGYLAAQTNSRAEVTRFLDKVTNYCIDRWGYRKSFKTDEGDEDNDPTEEFDLASFVVAPNDDISEAEAQTQSAYYSDLRLVSQFVLSWLANG